MGGTVTAPAGRHMIQCLLGELSKAGRIRMKGSLRGSRWYPVDLPGKSAGK